MRRKPNFVLPHNQTLQIRTTNLCCLAWTTMSKVFWICKCMYVMTRQVQFLYRYGHVMINKCILNIYSLLAPKHSLSFASAKWYISFVTRKKEKCFMKYFTPMCRHLEPRGVVGSGIWCPLLSYLTLLMDVYRISDVLNILSHYVTNTLLEFRIWSIHLLCFSDLTNMTDVCG